MSIRRFAIDRIRAAAGLAAAVLLAACGSSGVGEGNTLASLRIVDASGNQPAGVLEIPRCVPTQLRVFGTFDDGGVEDISQRVGLSWSSSNAAGIPISNGGAGSDFAKGVVTPSGAVGGTAIIRAEFGSLSATQEVRIQAARLEITSAQSQTAIGDLRLPLFLTGIFGAPGAQTRVDISDRVEWQSSDTSIATVEAQSLDSRTLRFFIVPKKTATSGTVDTVTITADTGIAACGADGRPSFAFKVHNKALTALTVSPAGPLTLPPQVSLPLTVQARYGDFLQDVTGLVRYSAVDPANPSQASLRARFTGNRVLALSQGSATLKTVLDQFGAEGDGTNDVAGNDVTLNVNTATLRTDLSPPVALQISPQNPSMISGTTLAFNATGQFTDGNSYDLSQDVFWSSSDTDVAVFGSLLRNLITALESSSTPVVVTALRGGFCDTDTATTLPACPTTNLTTNASLASLAITDGEGNACSPCTVPLGGAAQLQAIGSLSGGGTQDLTSAVIWESDASATAIVSNASGLTGRALGLAAGNATVRARFGSVTSPDATLSVIQDADGDGVADAQDLCPNTPPGASVNDDGCEDTDGDGVIDASDNCPNVANADQANTDGAADGGDACDADDDNDGDADSADNCPLVANADQLNTDGDAQGDACDTDDDNDGVADGSDQCPVQAAGSNPSNSRPGCPCNNPNPLPIGPACLE
ncbi:MAG TPA: thrombospondin type 3 repeat-containing protein [Nevskiales bacterium]|nr:thrombospondin type 3 repeat-containing protein [Nevskiales bacterium]